LIEKFIKNKIITILYEIFITVLALVAVVITFLELLGKFVINETKPLYYLDLGILIIFIVDYIIRLRISKNKKEFFKNNIFDFIAILPFTSLLRIFRAFRLFRLLKIVKVIKLVKLITFFKMFTSRIRVFLHTNGFIYTVYISFSIVLLGAVGIYIVENNKTVSSFEDALWWSFVTTTTVGYGDISPTTNAGRLIAGVLMMVGIGFIGMLTSTIATYFLKRKPSTLCASKNELDVSDLTQEELNTVKMFVEFLRSKRD